MPSWLSVMSRVNSVFVPLACGNHTTGSVVLKEKTGEPKMSARKKTCSGGRGAAAVFQMVGCDGGCQDGLAGLTGAAMQQQGHPPPVTSLVATSSESSRTSVKRPASAPLDVVSTTHLQAAQTA